MDALATEMAGLLGAETAAVDLHRFPDGESLVTLPDTMTGRNVIILTTLRDPDPLALPLRFTAATARELGAARVGLVAPYLAYMRQDTRFAPGQAVTAPLFARYLEDSFDWLVTADPHLHRIPSLGRLFGIPAIRVQSAPLIADWISREVPDAVILGPDSESQQWVAEVARMAGRPFEVLSKVRSGDRNVQVSVPESEALTQGTPVILDDIASSGRTMIRAIERLAAAGTRPPVCVVIHAVFAAGAHDEILAAGAARVITTNSIPHPSNAISLAEPLAANCIQAMSGMVGKPTGQTSRSPNMPTTEPET
ncbi:phosphoribosylpyrophosphate synthetase [Pseudaestuariivita atlantica]|uniref:Phosphoribosylpyrophosphate synthetase n=2 Tax=Pseudaestuariivita atlantica TaxID=1317121 RepID=A0A0L1JSA0_9RHOB|nr:phosphoribosylpyrophosphate synthetase [Pseudaestuariivita atlantica]